MNYIVSFNQDSNVSCDVVANLIAVFRGHYVDDAGETLIFACLKSGSRADVFAKIKEVNQLIKRATKAGYIDFTCSADIALAHAQENIAVVPIERHSFGLVRMLQKEDLPEVANFDSNASCDVFCLLESDVFTIAPEVLSMELIDCPGIADNTYEGKVRWLSS